MGWDAPFLLLGWGLRGCGCLWVWLFWGCMRLSCLGCVFAADGSLYCFLILPLLILPGFQAAAAAVPRCGAVLVRGACASHAGEGMGLWVRSALGVIGPCSVPFCVCSLPMIP